jgi:hypothetical protein
MTLTALATIAPEESAPESIRVAYNTSFLPVRYFNGLERVENIHRAFITRPGVFGDTVFTIPAHEFERFARDWHESLGFPVDGYIA